MTDAQLKHLKDLQELREKGVLTPEQFEKEKSKVLDEANVVISSDEEYFTEALSAKAMAAVFDAYEVKKAVLRKSFIYRFYKRARNFSMSVNKRIPKTSKIGEAVSGAELIKIVAQEYRNSGFEVLEQQNHIKVWLEGVELKENYCATCDFLGVIVFVSREKTWQVTGRFDADVYRTKMDTLGTFWALVLLVIVGIFFWPVLICALCAVGALFSNQKDDQLKAAKDYAQKPLDDVLQHYVVSDI